MISYEPIQEIRYLRVLQSCMSTVGRLKLQCPAGFYWVQVNVGDFSNQFCILGLLSIHVH